MHRFLDYTESLCDSPPASFPGSPVQSLSEDCDELDSQNGIPGTALSRQLNDIHSTLSFNGKKYEGLHSGTENTHPGVYSLNPDLLTAEDGMSKWKEDLLLGPADTDSDSESEDLPTTEIDLMTPDPTTSQVNKGETPSKNNILPPKVSTKSMHGKVQGEISTTLAELIIPGTNSIFSKSGWNIIKVVLLIIICGYIIRVGY